MQEAMLKRLELQAKIAGQRDDLGHVAQDFAPALQIADQTVVAAKFLRRHLVLTGAVVGLAVLRRRGAAVLIKTVWRTWKFYRYASAMLGENLRRS